jgi:small GTP-binding protein
MEKNKKQDDNKGKDKKETEIMYKIITIGDTEVGKSAIIRRVVRNTFEEKTMSTIGMNLFEKKITLKNNKEITLQLVDTAGQERYKSIGKSYFKNADGVLFVFALNNLQSFENIPNWMKIFDESSNETLKIPKNLVGNKKDLGSEIEVNEDIINDFLKKNNNFIYKAVSAKEDNNEIHDLFQEMAERLYEEDIKNGHSKNKTTVKLTNEKQVDRRGCKFKKCIM